MTNRRTVRVTLIWMLLGFASTQTQIPRAYAPEPQSRDGALAPGTRVLLDGHNAYPYDDRWADRIDRALATGTPLAIEQDLVWYRDPATGQPRSIVSHGEPFSGHEPTLEQYFFQRVRPLMEQALRDNRRETWPVLVLNLDFKTNEPEHHRAIWELLGRYDSWLCTAPRMAPGEIAPMRAGPLLVLTGEADEQELSFHDAVRAGDALRLFGAVHRRPDGTLTPKSNYRRWSNNPWSVVEAEGQPKAGAWTPADEQRLTDVVRAAHDAGLWIRFYTLNGHDPTVTAGGWSASYNFGSLEAVTDRWRAAIRAGVDFIAVDQYEEFAAVRAAMSRSVAR